MHEHVSEVEHPLQPALWASRCDERFKLCGEVALQALTVTRLFR
jgi:hypothetical protein